VEHKEMKSGSGRALTCCGRRLAERNPIKEEMISGEGDGNDTRGGCAPQT